jgi:hypothetical protein
MGDDLPGLEGKLESGRCACAPAGNGFQSGQLIETGINFDARKCAKISFLGECETAASDEYWSEVTLQSNASLAGCFRLAKCSFQLHHDYE